MAIHIIKQQLEDGSQKMSHDLDDGLEMWYIGSFP